MSRKWILSTLIFTLLPLGCRSGKQGTTEETTPQEAPQWWETETEDTEEDSTNTEGDNTDESEENNDKPEDTGEAGSSDVPDCDENFDPEQPCEGDWTSTLCFYEGLMWWCEGGVWLNEDDKPD